VVPAAAVGKVVVFADVDATIEMAITLRSMSIAAPSTRLASLSSPSRYLKNLRWNPPSLIWIQMKGVPAWKV
jgi:hypothetical protein